jgi:hypothetical protein
MYEKLKRWLHSPELWKRQAARLALDAIRGTAAERGLTEADVIAAVEAIEREEGVEETLIDEYVRTVTRALTEAGRTLPGDVYFNIFPTSDFNACAQATPHGYLCLLNQGLCELLYNVSLACLYPLRANTEKELFGTGSDLASLLPGQQDLRGNSRLQEALTALRAITEFR